MSAARLSQREQLKARDLSNNITVNPPLFSLVNTFKKCHFFLVSVDLFWPEGICKLVDFWVTPPNWRPLSGQIVNSFLLQCKLWVAPDTKYCREDRPQGRIHRGA